MGSHNSLLSPGLRRAILFNQRWGRWAMRLVFSLVRNHITVLLEPGDLEPGFRYVIASNHQSMFDPFVICGALPVAMQRRLMPFRFFAHNGLFETPLLRSFLLAFGSFPASAHPYYAYGIEAAASFLGQRQTVVIFPQGRRNLDKGQARSGVAVLAQAPNVRVIPARIEWQKRGWRRSFRLVIGRPLEDKDLSAQQILNRIYKLEP